MLEFIPKGDERGWLIAIENLKQVPFAIRRVYYIYGTRPGVRRGCHAHRTLRQLAICMAGSCRFLLDDGKQQQIVLLDRNTNGLLIEPLVWHEMYDFSPDCVLMVLASDYYTEKDYIRERVIFNQISGIPSQ